MTILSKTLKHTSLFLLMISLLFSLETAAQPDAPNFQCLSKSGNELVFTWQNNGNCGADFIATSIFEGPTPIGPFTEIFTTSDPNVSTINVVNATPNAFEFYFIQTACTDGTADSEILDELLPPPVTILSVTVNFGAAILAWEPSTSSDAYAYGIYRKNQVGLFQLVDTVFIADLADSDNPFYIDPYSMPTIQSEEYAVNVMDFCGNAGSVLQGISHSSIYLTSNFDASSQEVSLMWTAYKGWEIEGGVQSYRVYRGFEQVAELSNEQFVYTYQITSDDPQPVILSINALKADGITTSNSNLIDAEQNLIGLVSIPNNLVKFISAEKTIYLNAPKLIEQLNIFTISGQMVESHSNLDNQATINLAHLNSGVYLIEVQIGIQQYVQKIHIP